MKEKTKIWVIANWDEIYDSNVGVRTFRNFPDFDSFELSETDYEYLIVLGGFRSQDKKYYKSKDKTFGFLLEPYWSGNWQRDLPNQCKLVVAQEKSMYPQYDNVIEHPMFMFTQSTEHHNFYLEEMDSIAKFRRMSIVISNFGPKPLYEERVGIFRALLNTDLDIDFYGRNWQVDDFRYKGAPYNKSDALRNYQYSIAIENCSQKNYLTEKFFDLVVCNTVPLYHGCPNVSEIYNPKSFFQLDFSGPIEKTVEQVKDIYYNDDYEKRLPYVLGAKRDYYNKYNIFSFLKRIIRHET